MLGRLRRWLIVPGRPMVRPWALSAPVVVLLIALPLLRPLRQPDATRISDNELARLATVQSLVEHRTLAIDKSDFYYTQDQVQSGNDSVGSPRRYYSKQPPMLSVLLAGPYWALNRLGISFATNPGLVFYLLTLLGATLPVALAAGMVYRMGRLFELTRPWRAGLALATVCAGGLISYATVLNSHAPAAALVLLACASLFHVATVGRRARAPWWFLLAGLCAATAAAVDLAAVVFLVLLLAVILTLRWSWGWRAAGVALYALGAAGPLALHIQLTQRITGDMLPGFLHPELAVAADDRRLIRPYSAPAPKPATRPAQTQPTTRATDEEPSEPGLWSRGIDALVGSHGLLSHFPVVVLGMAGVWVMVRRHWPMPAKAMALVTAAAAVAIIGAYIILQADWRQPMFATRWYILFLPLLLYWSGAWLRRPHRPATWALAGVLLAYSLATSLLGATDPFIENRDGRFTAYVAARQLITGQPPMVSSPAPPQGTQPGWSLVSR